VLGKQGAGKGTQCLRLSHRYVVPHVSTGDLFRAAVRSGSPVGQKAKDFMDRGELIPDEVVLSLVAWRLGRDDTVRGFVLDGFPRNVHQAEGLSELLNPSDIDLALDIDVPTPLVLRRLAERRVCKDCGENYSLRTRPRFNWTCDVCGGEVVQRDDDTVEAITRRLEIYERQTAPLVEWYRSRGLLAVVNGVGSPDAVTARLGRKIDERRRTGGRRSVEPGEE
jgi:adenylate kinase